MKKIFLLLVAVLVSTGISQAQEDNLLTLSECYLLAEQNHPLSKQHALIEESTLLAIENLNRNYYPGFSLNGQVSYQSDVTKVPSKVPIPGFEIEPIDKD